MHGVVSLLDDQHYQLVEDLWAELKQEFAVEGVYMTRAIFLEFLRLYRVKPC